MRFSSFADSVLSMLSSIRLQLLVAARSPVPGVNGERRTRHSDADFEGWLGRDPFAIENSGNRYGEGSPGYMTGNGRGSLEVGAADD